MCPAPWFSRRTRPRERGTKTETLRDSDLRLESKSDKEGSNAGGPRGAQAFLNWEISQSFPRNDGGIQRAAEDSIRPKSSWPKTRNLGGSSGEAAVLGEEGRKRVENTDSLRMAWEGLRSLRSLPEP